MYLKTKRKILLSAAAAVRDDIVHPLVSRRETQPAITVDSLGRTHLRYLRTGPLRIKLRPQKFCTATNLNHLNDLRECIQISTRDNKKKSVFIVCDNGPDWSKLE